MQEPIIRTQGLKKQFRDENTVYDALKGVSFSVYEKEIIGLSGSSGSGKSTLLGILGCLETPTEGELTLFGYNVMKLNDKELSELRLRQIGFIFQEHNLLPALTVQENLELPLRLLNQDRLTRSGRVDELLEIVELEDLRDRYPSQLSRGQRQRIAAIRAFANEPRLILADEPTSDLDPENAEILLSFLKQLNKQKGTTVIIAATNPEIFHGITDRNLTLFDGKIKSDL
jgi:ABC-type lipoprotein export system ATPase subunit